MRSPPVVTRSSARRRTTAPPAQGVLEQGMVDHRLGLVLKAGAGDGDTETRLFTTMGKSPARRPAKRGSPLTPRCLL